MTITVISHQVLRDHSAVQVRFRAGAKGEPKEYDCKPLFSASRRGWTVLDATTARAIVAVHDALRADLRPKMDTIPLGKLIDFCWKVVS